MPTIRTLVITSTAAAALALTGCSQEQPVRHGEVIKKHGQAGHWVPVYEDIYRDRCTSVHTSAFTMSLTSRTTGGSGGRSTTSGGTGKSLTSGGSGKSNSGKSSGSTTGGTRPGNNSITSGGSNGSSTSGSTGSSTGGRSTPRCQQEYVGRKKTGDRWQKGRWELKLRDGDRTGWIQVSKHTYDTTDLHDHV